MTDVYAPLQDLSPPLFKFGPIRSQISTNAPKTINYTTRAPFVEIWGRLDNPRRVIGLAAVKILAKDKKTTRRDGRGSKTAATGQSNRWLLACRRDLGIVYRDDVGAVMRQRDAMRMQGGGALAADQRPGDFSRSRVAGDFSPQPKGGGVFFPQKKQHADRAAL